MHTYANTDIKRVAGLILTISSSSTNNGYHPKATNIPIRAVGDWCIQCPHTDYALKTKYCFTGIQSALANNGLLISRH